MRDTTTGGMTLAPGSRSILRQVENVLYEHDGIEEVSVLYVTDENDKESLVAFVVPRNDRVTEEEIMQFLQDSGQLEPDIMPRLVKFVPKIPKSPSGKVLKIKLLEEVCV